MRAQVQLLDGYKVDYSALRRTFHVSSVDGLHVFLMTASSTNCRALCVTVPMVGGQALRMDSGNGSGVVVDDSPASSPSSSPSPDGRRRELQRARVLQAGGLGGRGRPAAANAARERSRVQTLRNAFLELQRTLPSVPPDTKLSKLDVLILATTYIAHLTRTLQEEGSEEGESSKPTELHPLKGEGYLHPVKKWPMRSRLYVGATGQFLNATNPSEAENQGPSSSSSQ